MYVLLSTVEEDQAIREVLKEKVGSIIVCNIKHTILKQSSVYADNQTLSPNLPCKLNYSYIVNSW